MDKHLNYDIMNICKHNKQMNIKGIINFEYNSLILLFDLIRSSKSFEHDDFLQQKRFIPNNTQQGRYMNFLSFLLLILIII